MKRYLVTYLPALAIAIILFIVLPQELKFLVSIPVIVSGLIYTYNK